MSVPVGYIAVPLDQHCVLQKGGWFAPGWWLFHDITQEAFKVSDNEESDCDFECADEGELVVVVKCGDTQTRSLVCGMLDVSLYQKVGVVSDDYMVSIKGERKATTLSHYAARHITREISFDVVHGFEKSKVDCNLAIMRATGMGSIIWWSWDSILGYVADDRSPSKQWWKKRDAMLRLCKALNIPP